MEETKEITALLNSKGLNTIDDRNSTEELKSSLDYCLTNRKKLLERYGPRMWVILYKQEVIGNGITLERAIDFALAALQEVEEPLNCLCFQQTEMSIRSIAFRFEGAQQPEWR